MTTDADDTMTVFAFTRQTIDQMWMVVMSTQEGEGLISQKYAGLTFPMIETDEAKVAALIKETTEMAANGTDVKLKVIKFSKRETIAEFEPFGIRTITKGEA